MLHECFHPAKHRLTDCGAHHRGGLFENIQYLAGDRFETPKGCDAFVRFGVLVKVRDPPREGFNEFDPYLIATQTLLKSGLVGQALHFHGPFDDFPISLETYARSGPCHRHHAEVDVRCQAAIESDLFLAVLAALLQGAEIQEAELNGLFDFVDVGIGQEYGRDVGLSNFDRPDRIGIRGSLGQRFYQ